MTLAADSDSDLADAQQGLAGAAQAISNAQPRVKLDDDIARPSVAGPRAKQARIRYLRDIGH